MSLGPGFASPQSALPGIYRLVSPSLTTGAKHGSLNDNITFVTNIPSLDFALRIWRIRWVMGWSSWGGDFTDASTGVDIQVFAQLTENQTKTSITTTDTSFLDEVWQQVLTEGIKDTAAGFMQYGIPNLSMEVIHDFSPMTTPFTVATKLNLVASMVENSSALGGTTVFRPFCQLEYTLERLTSDLRDYLSKRLQIQGS